MIRKTNDLSVRRQCELLGVNRSSVYYDPTVNQSGKFKARSTNMSKRGSKTLRFALINAAWQLTLNDSVFFDYYSLKRSQGLDHYGALGHVAHKLVRVIFKLLKSNSPFIHDRLQNV